MSHKLVVTNVGRLKAKYGEAAYAQILARVQGLVEADQRRGVTTHLAELDGGPGMDALLGAGASGVVVRDWASAEQVKRAIDALYGAPRSSRGSEPSAGCDFVMILGATDVVPMVQLQNETFGNGSSMNGDRICPSDVPYACDALATEASLSTSMYAYMAPTRVLSRLPDQLGARDPAPFLTALQTTIDWRASAPDEFAKHLGITAEIWKEQTTKALVGGLGLRGNLEVVPPEEPGQNQAPEWDPSLWRQNLHYINCHGAEGRPYFLGQGIHQVGSLPQAHVSTQVLDHARAGTVVVAECCYGACLYEPAKGAEPPMPNAYFARGGLGFIGSTITAYGSGTGEAFSDKLCQLVVKHLMAGASLGRAMLDARHDYVEAFDKDATTGILLSRWDVAALCAFNAYGDPSVLPVRVVAAKDGAAAQAHAAASDAAGAGALGEHIQHVLSGRSERRQKIRERAQRLRRTTAVATKPATDNVAAQGPANPVQIELAGRIQALGRYFPTVCETQDVRPPGVAAPQDGGAASSTSRARFHILHAEHEDGAEHKQTAFQALEVDGQIVRLDQLIRR